MYDACEEDGSNYDYGVSLDDVVARMDAFVEWTVAELGSGKLPTFEVVRCRSYNFSVSCVSSLRRYFNFYCICRMDVRGVDEWDTPLRREKRIVRRATKTYRRPPCVVRS
ncbi:hypothetical protein H632_c2443p1 [Helicosporidium sp. ATCC 50920]|nr:hypothetical protein H632_c2443p1 [Helicosporidium sp. ATCC 50920]|eukprot:KDD73191.1 hypothetical protein H632_c2443p1 [Helicosporidium sp. ATCC 50920]